MLIDLTQIRRSRAAVIGFALYGVFAGSAIGATVWALTRIAIDIARALVR